MDQQKRWFGLCLMVLMSQVVGCAIYPIRVEVEHRETAAFAGVKKLVVETRNGAIEVACDPHRKDIDIQSVKSACGITQEDVRKMAERIEIEVVRDPADAGVLRVTAKMPTGEVGRNQAARFKIGMPPEAELCLETSNGHVTSQGCAKDVHITTSNGRITVEDCKGSVEARTSNGAIATRDVQGDVDVQSTNGGIDLQRVGRNSVKARTSNGHIRIVDAAGEANVQTSNGSVELRCKSVPPTPRIQVVTSNGRVEVEIPRSVNADLDMNTSNGRVKADLHDVRISDFDSGRSRLRARLNDGGGKIDIQASNGSITLRTVGEAAVKPVADRS